ncbi:MAG: DUF4920 domain-containing protein [Pseudomonadota bacterium]
MRGIFVCLISAVASLASSQALRLSEPVEVTDQYEVFGEPMPDKRAGLQLGEVIARQDVLLEQPLRITATVSQVCQKKGCFFIATDGAHWARVTFADYRFFIPTDSAGKQATVVGQFSRRKLSAKQAEHYAEDLGQARSTIDTPQFEYSIEANAIVLRN